ncbi:MAG: transcriptional repressor [Candidatus Aminicenantes bacterium]|nr:transcriptional repressor [Candidatus Aminicenantes bacterium]
MPGPNKWRHRFRNHVSRWTLPREAILDLLAGTSNHMSAKEIYDALSNAYPGIGLSTIYRTLNLLVRTDFLNQIHIGDGQSRYEFKSGEKDEHHHHLICTKCGRIIDYNDFLEEELELVNKAEKSVAGKYDFIIHDHNIDFFGICRQCQK